MDQILSKGAGKVSEIKARAHGLVGVFATLAEQHGEAHSLLGRLAADPAKHGALWPTIRAALVSHEGGELREVYPALREYRELIALADLHEGQATQLSAAVEAVGLLGDQPKPEQLMPLLRNLMRLVESHVAEEEGDIFPRAQEVIGDARAKELDGKFVAAAKRIQREQLQITMH